MHRRRVIRALVVCTAAAFVTVVAPSLARAESTPAFKTPGDAAYCQMEFSRNTFDAFRCFTPNDGWWIRFTGVMGHNVQVTKGYAPRYRSHRPSGFQTLGFGKNWTSSDAMAVTCWSRTSGLTCKQFDGLSFWIGRFKGYRIFVSPAGTRVEVARPFFRTSFGVYCGLGVSMEPDAPYVQCWRPADGLELSLPHAVGYKASWRRNENDRGYRPTGHLLLMPSTRFSWTCESVETQFATGCTRNGSTMPVFTCTTTSSRLTCRNDTGHGFWISRTSFYTY
jgi:hypothetical protein